MKRYTKEHLWMETTTEGNYRMGLTQYGLDRLGEVAYISRIAAGEHKRGDVLTTIETFKTVHDVAAPCDVTVVSVADYGSFPDEIEEHDGYLCDVRAADIGETMTEDEYAEYCKEQK